MVIVAGTLPFKGLGLLHGKVEVEGERLRIGGATFPISRGTAAIAAACALATEGEVEGVVVGDTGKGEGSAELYRFLEEEVPRLSPKVVCLGYVMPNKELHDRAFKALGRMNPRPLLVADAGFMYVAKMSGKAIHYDLFCPDLGELAFLADEKAPHPFYTRGFIFHMTERVPELIKGAYETGGAAKVLLVKGERDYVCKDGEILEVIKEPKVPDLEPIGGTGDTITGMTAALIAQGSSLVDAAARAARANRRTGELARPNPATQIGEILHHIPRALEEVVWNENRCKG